jgi:hypothetical protein
MKKYLPVIILFLSTLLSCEKTDNQVFFRLGSGKEFKFSDIELYDTSANVLYFKEGHDEFKKFEYDSFVFLNGGEEIYSGSFWPGYSSSMPTGPFIWAPSMMSTFAIQIDNRYNENPDVRKDPGMISVLKKHGLFHSGLAFSSSSIEIAGAQLTFRFTLTNKDESDLLIFDIDKTGPELFHYFTNGLYIRDKDNNELFSSNIQYQKPEPWNSWSIDWLSQLKSGEAKEFTINYTLPETIPAGDYTASFEFPGLSNQVTLEQLYQGTDRIWLGDISLEKRLIVQ